MNFETHEFDVCVVGGGMAGICAAIASARNGAKTAIVQDRPVFGGNASSEIRMWICGAHGVTNREAGLMEEIFLEHLYRNPDGNYSIWDSILYEKIQFQPNLTSFVNCSCTDVEMDGDRIVAIKAWQLTTQTWHTIQARVFIDCSGDSILGAASGADFRAGRESKQEFDEDIQPLKADRKTMGNTILIQLRRTEQSQRYTPPRWAYKFYSPSDLPHRIKGVNGHNFWWIEVGGLQDTIRDAETIKHDLMRIGYGVWDYIKNHAPEREQAENWALEWMGSLPGKRENRRLMGDHILTQNDVRSGGNFEDIVAYGGWTLDDHHPAGIYFPAEPSILHPAPSPFGIPYRCLYSRNVKNLLFAGRNISVTHAALSATRVMATCALLGQAAGTAAALCIRHQNDPRSLNSGSKLVELQNTLMEDDCWLPGLLRKVSHIAKQSKITTKGLHGKTLLDGLDRDRPESKHAWLGALGEPIEFNWDRLAKVGGVRIVFDSSFGLNKRMPCSYPVAVKNAPPKSIVKSFRLEALNKSGQWESVYREEDNYQRLAYVPLSLETKGLRFIPEETHGSPDVRIFALEPLENCTIKQSKPPDGPRFIELRSKMAPEDVKPFEGEYPEAERYSMSA